MKPELFAGNQRISVFHEREDLRLEGGIGVEEGTSSSGSRDRLRLLMPAAPLFADDMLGRSGELAIVSQEASGSLQQIGYSRRRQTGRRVLSGGGGSFETMTYLMLFQ